MSLRLAADSRSDRLRTVRASVVGLDDLAYLPVTGLRPAHPVGSCPERRDRCCESLCDRHGPRLPLRQY